jgi:hypothetical protein
LGACYTDVSFINNPSIKMTAFSPLRRQLHRPGWGCLESPTIYSRPRLPHLCAITSCSDRTGQGGRRVRRKTLLG